MHPLVSIVMPAYNQALFLEEALNSILQQSYPHLEIILVDDGSTDDTPAICQAFKKKDQRLHSIRQENRGPSAARNRAIAQAKGEYICLLDADDRMEEKKLECQLDVLIQHPSIDLVYTALFIMDQTGNRIGEIRSQPYPPEDFLALMFFRNLIPNPNTIMAKRACLASHPYNEHFKHAEDYELMLRLAHHYRFEYLDSPLTSYRRHLTNLSNNLRAHRQAELKVLNMYGRDHIEYIIERSHFDEKEKLLLKGKILFNRELFSDAAAIFKEIPSAIAYFYLGNCELQLHHIQQAIHNYETALQLDPTNAACHNNLGVGYLVQGHLQRAEAHFQHALALKPDYLDAKYNLEQPNPQTPRPTFRELRKDLLPYIDPE